MKILLMRHGEAVRGDGLDEARHLSRTGRSDTARVARALASMIAGERVTHVVASHLVRAVQSAEIVRATLEHAGIPIDELVHGDPRFAPDEAPRYAAENLERLALEHAGGYVLVACHEPIVRGIAAHLTGRTSFAPFATSGLVAIVEGRVSFALDPRSAVAS